MSSSVLYSEELANAICERLAGGESLNSICRAHEMPAESTVRLWEKQDLDGFAAKYAQARATGYERMADELIEIADDGQNDWMERNAQDNKGWEVNGEHVQRSRLRIDARKWMLSKMLPKVYGDKQTNVLENPDGTALGVVMIPAKASGT